MASELDYNITDQEPMQAKRYEQLNTDQKQPFDEIVTAIAENRRNAHFFL